MVDLYQDGHIQPMLPCFLTDVLMNFFPWLRSWILSLNYRHFRNIQNLNPSGHALRCMNYLWLWFGLVLFCRWLPIPTGVFLCSRFPPSLLAWTTYGYALCFFCRWLPVLLLCFARTTYELITQDSNTVCHPFLLCEPDLWLPRVLGGASWPA